VNQSIYEKKEEDGEEEEEEARKNGPKIKYFYCSIFNFLQMNNSA
jgi:hypothetical protein